MRYLMWVVSYFVAFLFARSNFEFMVAGSLIFLAYDRLSNPAA